MDRINPAVPAHHDIWLGISTTAGPLIQTARLCCPWLKPTDMGKGAFGPGRFGVHSDLSLTRQALPSQLSKVELHSRSISNAAAVPARLALFCKNDMNLAANEKIDELFPLAAVPANGFVFANDGLPETRVWNSDFEKRAFIGASSWLSSTARWVYIYQYPQTRIWRERDITRPDASYSSEGRAVPNRIAGAANSSRNPRLY